MSVNIVKNKPVIYGLTGGIASGKSLSANFFINNKIKVFDSDSCVKEIWENNKKLISDVSEKYLIDIKTTEGKKILAGIIFNDEIERAYINSIIHPIVFEEINLWLEKNKEEDFVIIDMPLLFESGYEKNVFKTIVIYTKKSIQKKRLMSRDNLLKSEAVKRINSQLHLKLKRKMADYVIKNNGSKEKLTNQLEKLLEVMINESRV